MIAGAERRCKSDHSSVHAIIQCKLSWSWGWMITTFLRSSMPSLKMQMSDSPPCSPPLRPPPPPLHSWSLLFDLFIFNVGEPDGTMASFITEAAFPLPAPWSPPESLIHQAALMWPGHGGLALLRKGNTERVILLGQTGSSYRFLTRYRNIYRVKRCQAKNKN